jgi:hypothetical protein
MIVHLSDEDIDLIETLLVREVLEARQNADAYYNQSLPSAPACVRLRKATDALMRLFARGPANH